MTPKDPRAWRFTPKGRESYTEARAKAQRRANFDGYDRGLQANDFSQEHIVFILPARQYRCGHETQCEAVMCEDLDKCQPGHGPVRQ